MHDAINAIDNRIIAAARLLMLPGQDSHNPSVQGIDMDAIETSTMKASANLLPQTLVVETTSTQAEREAVPCVLDSDEQEQLTVVPCKATVEVDGHGIAWVIASIFALLSVCIVSFFIFSSNKFAAFAARRHGRPGGGTASILARVFSRIRYRLRARGALNVTRLKTRNEFLPNRRNFRTYLVNYDFSYRLWQSRRGLTDAEMQIVADQNAFVGAVKAVDEGDETLAAAAVVRLRQIFDQYLDYEPAYFNKILNKSVYLASLSASSVANKDTADLLGLGDVRVFEPEACGLPNVQTCSLQDIVDCDLSKVFYPENTDMKAAKTYVDMLRNFQLMFSVAGTVHFVAIYASYSGAQYPCVQEAYAKDKELRKEQLDTKQTEKSSTTADVASYALAASSSIYALSMFVKHGKKVFKFVRGTGGPSGEASTAAIDALPELPTSGGHEHSITDLEARLERLRGPSGEASAAGIDTSPEPSTSSGSERNSMADLEARLERLCEGVRDNVSIDGDLSTRRSPDDVLTDSARTAMSSRANLAFSGLPALIATSPALVTTASIDKDLSSHGRNEIVPNDYLSVARAEGQPLIAMRAGGEEITIINADSDSPTLIRTETLSKRPSSVGVEYGSFSRERIISLSKELTVEGEPSPIAHKDNTRTVANLAMSAVAIAASVDAARKGKAKQTTKLQNTNLQFA